MVPDVDGSGESHGDSGDGDGKSDITPRFVAFQVIIVTLTKLGTMVISVIIHQGVLPFKYKQIFKILEKKASGKLYGDNR